MKKILMLLCLLFLSSSATANVFITDDVYLNCDDDETYKAPDLPFERIVFDDDWVEFNYSRFECTFDVDVTATINYLAHSDMYPYGNLTVLDFNFIQEIGGMSSLTFNISGFLSSEMYEIYTDGTFDQNVTSTDAGFLNFTPDILNGKITIIWQVILIFHQLNGEGAGRGDEGGDYLYDEVPLNNTYVLFDSDGINTSISIDYNNFIPPVQYEYEQVTPITHYNYFGLNYELAQDFTIGTVATNESFFITQINLSFRFMEVWLDYYDFGDIIVNLTNSTGTSGDVISTGVLSVDDFIYTPTGELFFVWYEIGMTPFWLSKGCNYTIAVSSPDSENALICHWSKEYHASSDPYTGGSAIESRDGGISWDSVGANYHDLNFVVWGVNTSFITNVTFEWYNETLGDWQQYGFFPMVINQTTTVLNENFSGIYQTYMWRVTAVANDTGVTHSEWFSFKTYACETEARISGTVVLSCGFLAIPFLYSRMKKKEDEEDAMY